MTSDCNANLQESSRLTGPAFPVRSIITILVIALLGRILAVWEFVAHHPRTWLFCHPYEMGFVANSLIHGLGYSSPFGIPTGPTAIVAPGYPTLIATIFLIFGSSSFTSAIVIMSLQILVNLLTICLMMRVAAEVLDRRSALVAGSFWAVSLPLLWIPTIFWETSISACAMVGMIALALRCRRAPTLPAWVLLGVFCSITSLINPALLGGIPDARRGMEKAPAWAGCARGGVFPVADSQCSSISCVYSAAQHDRAGDVYGEPPRLKRPPRR
jgi:hypothetical protein